MRGEVRVHPEPFLTAAFYASFPHSEGRSRCKGALPGSCRGRQTGPKVRAKDPRGGGNWEGHAKGFLEPL